MKNFFALVFTTALVCAGPLAFAANRTVTLSVQKMTCSACPITVKTALTRVEGVKRARVSFERQEAIVTYDDAKTGPQALIEATTAVGYPATVKPR